MPEFNIRTDSVDVEQIMRQIRARIKEKRGVDYTEQQIQELANVKLERFLDPKGVRSDLVEQFKRTRDTRPDPFVPEQYGFDAEMLYGSHRGIVRLIRRVLNPILKLFFNPNPLIHVLHWQTRINALYEKQLHLLREKNQQRDEVDVLYYELVHNLVLELTRVGIETKNLKMRLESLNSRIDFDERRARALEGVVQYKAGTGPSREASSASGRSTRDTGSTSARSTREAGSVSNRSSSEAGGSSSRGSGEAGTPSPRSSGEAGPGPSRAFEQQARPATPPSQPEIQGPQSVPSGVASIQGQPAPQGQEEPAADGTLRRRRRRRRGRRGGRGRGMADAGAGTGPAPDESTAAAATPPHGDSTAEAALGAADPATDSEDGDFDSGEDEGPDSGQ